MNTVNKGKQGEDLAAAYLQKRDIVFGHETFTIKRLRLIL